MRALIFIIVVVLATTEARFSLKIIGKQFEKSINDVLDGTKESINKVTKLNQKSGVSYAKDIKWSVCGGDVIKVNSLSIGPNPIRIPGTVTAAFDVNVLKNITAPIKAELNVRIKKKIIGWIKIPCIDDVGSCSYDNICSDVSKKCPDILQKYGIPCACPFPAGHFNMPTNSFDVKGSVPSILKHGDYKIELKLTSPQGYLLCMKIEFELK